jgi:hypothetical protein
METFGYTLLLFIPQWVSPQELNETVALRMEWLLLKKGEGCPLY